MDEYQVDIHPSDVLGWVRDDAARRTPRLLVGASKEYRVDTDFDRQEAGIGDDEDVALVTTVGTLTVTPLRGRRGWVLRVRSEDNIGLRSTPEEGDAEDDDDLPIDAFVEQFLTPARPDVDVTVVAEDADAWRRFQRWLKRRAAGTGQA